MTTDDLLELIIGFSICKNGKWYLPHQHKDTTIYRDIKYPKAIPLSLIVLIVFSWDSISPISLLLFYLFIDIKMITVIILLFFHLKTFNYSSFPRGANSSSSTWHTRLVPIELECLFPVLCVLMWEPGSPLLSCITTCSR